MNEIIARVAAQHGISTEQCRAAMIEAIEAAWATTDPAAKDRQIQLVGEGRVPTPEELIFLISKEIT
jgi:transposase-like protein